MDTALAQLYDRLSALEQDNAMLRSHLQRCEQTCTVLQAEVAEYKQREQEWQTQTEITPEHERQAVNLESCNSPGETLGDSPMETPRDRILEATAAAANALLTLENFDQAVNTALKIIGECLDTDRVAVIENFDVPSERLPHWRMLYEWNAPHIPSQLLHSDAKQGRYEDIEEWYEQFIQGQGISHLLEEMPELLRVDLEKVEIKATHIVPIFVEGQFWGVLGFDDCREAKRRSAAELAMLKIAANCIGSAIQRDRTQQALLQAEQARSQELERINTELQQTLDRLSESEERFRTLFELSNEGFYCTEVDPPCPVTLPIDEQCEWLYHNIQVVKANPAFAAMYGVNHPDELIGLRNADVHVAGSEKNAVFIRDTIENGYRFRNLETEEIDSQGQLHYILNSGVYTIRDGYIVGAWNTQVDVTELRQTQQALLQAEQTRSQELERINAELQQTLDRLAESEKRYRTLFELSSEGILRWEYKQPIPLTLSVQEQLELCYQSVYIAEGNDAFAKMYEYEKAEELIGLTPNDFHDRNSQITRAAMQAWIENRYTCRSLETEEFDCHGRKRYFLNSTVSTIENDCVTSTWISQVDITELREAQQALLEAEQARVAELAKANEELQQREQEVQRSYRLLSVVAQVTKDLLEAEDVEIAIPAALQAVGEVANMSRVQLLLEHQEPATQKLQHVITYEWTAEGIVPQINHPDAATLDNDDFEFMLQDLYVGRSIWRLVDDFPSPIQEKFESIGIKSSGTVPIFIEGRYIGGVGFDDCTTPRRWSQQEIDVLTAAAESIGAALHRKQLVDRLIAERIHAEQERVAELKKANEALARTSERLAEQPDLSAFLSHIVLEAIAQLGADAAMLSTLDEQRQVLRAVAHVEQGHIPVSTLAAEMPVDEAGFVKVLLETRKPRYFNLEQEAHLFWAGSIEYHHQRNHKAVMGVPLYAGGNFLGHLGLAFTHTEPIQEQGSELLYALAQQAALAIQLTRLAEEAKQAAIAREQEKAAQERAAELAKANDALKHCLSRLAEESELNSFLGHVLLEIVQQVKAASGHIFLYDSRSNTLELRRSAVNGQVRSQALPDEPELFQSPFSADISPAFEYLCKSRRILLLNEQQHLESLAWTETLEWHCLQGHTEAAALALMAGDQPLGMLGLAFRDKVTFKPEELELIQALAHQAALAIQLTQLAEEAKQAAIAREQEKAAQERAEQLARANNALQKTVAALTTRRDLDGFIGEVLHTIARELDSPLVEYWTVLGIDTVEVETWIYANQLFSLRQGDDHPSRGGIRLLREYIGFEDFTQRSQAFTFDAPMPAYSLATQEVICPTDWYAARGVAKHFNFPLQAGDTTIGSISVWMPFDREISEESLRLGQTLSHQTALAIQLTRLAEEAKQAAIAREQEKAAQERAAELAKANEVLSRTSSRLAEQPNLSAFLGHIMLEAVAQLEADGGHLTIYDQQREMISTAVLVEQGKVVPSPDFPPDMPISEVGFIQLIRETRKLRYFDLEANFEQDAHLLWEDVGEHHKRRNHLVGIAIPLFIGDEFLGHFGLAFTYKKIINEQNIELLQALANQAALAIQLTKLAEEVKQAAIAREQEKAAQERAAELAKANDALRRSARNIAQNSGIEDILPLFLREALAVSGASAGAVLRRVGSSEFEFVAILQGDDLIRDERLKQHPFYNAVKQVSREDPTGWFTRLASGETLWRLTDDAQAGPLPESGDYHRPYEQRSVWDIPYKIGDRVAGYLSFAFQVDEGPSQIVAETVTALATQVGLALELTELAEAAKQAAIAREQEKAAQERAAELVKANKALKHAVGKLSEQPELDAFLGHVLTEAAEQIGACSNALFLYDQASHTLLMKTIYLHGQMADVATDPRLEIFRQPVPADVSPAWEAIQAGWVVTHEADGTDPNSHPQRPEWHREMGHETVIAVPLVVGGKAIGFMAPCFREWIEPNREKIELVQSLAHQATLALELTRLAEEAKQAAIAREQEKAAQERAAELVKANEALARTSSRLAEQPDLSSFLSHITIEAIAQLGADAGHLTILNEQRQTLCTVAQVEQDRLLLSANLAPEMSIAQAGFLQLLLETRKPRYFNLEQEAHLFWPGAIEYHRQRHHRAVLSVPLYAGGKFLGHLGLAFTHTDPIGEQGSELLQALSHQAALAIQLTQLAEEAKQAAIAREQEKAAQERAEQLARANEVLRRTASQLVEHQNLNHFLNSLLLEVAQEVGAVNNSIFLCDYQTKICRMHNCVQDGQVVDLETDPRFELWRTTLISEDNENWKLIQSRGHIWCVIEMEDRETDQLCDFSILWHYQMQHRSVMCVLLQVGDKPLGYMGLCFREPVQPSTDRIGLIQTLANQAALAIQLTQLAEEAKQAAIAREQEKAAQQQAAELSKANTLLRKSLSRLSKSPNLKDVLGHLLVELVRYAGASVGHIFIHDATQNTLTLSVRCQDGQAFWTSADDEPVLFRSPISVEHTPIFTHLCAQPRLAILNQDEFEGRMWEGVPQWFEAKGYRGICSCVLMVGDRPFGMLAMAFPQPVALRSVEEELILALTQQIALVIQLTTLGEADKQAAVAREQEKAAQERAAQLAKANDALKRSLNSLAADQSLDRFLENVMTSLAEQFNSTTAEYWSHRDGKTAFLELLTWEGTFYNRDAFAKVHPDHPGLAGYKVPPEMILSEPLDRRTQHFIIEDTSTQPDSFRNDRQWMYKYGIPKEINVPLNVGENTIGAFVVRMQQNVEITTEKVELAWALANQVALALELMRLADEAKQAAIFEERNRMASEIHDTLAQAFTGISLQLEVAKSLVHQDPQTVQQILDHLSRLAETGLAEARRSVWALYPPAAEYADLAQMLYESVEQMARNTSTSVEVNLQGTPCALPPLIGMNLLRIGQEAITNALKHAQAQTITIELSYEPDRIFLTIRDNGCGFTPPTHIDSLNGGFGLMGMYERCDRIGAQLSLTSQLGQGTQILVEAPLS